MNASPWKVIAGFLLAVLAIVACLAIPIGMAVADDSEPPHIVPTADPHGPEWGQPGDPLPEGMEEIDWERQTDELEAESPQGDPAPDPTHTRDHVDVTDPAVAQQIEEINREYAANPDFWADGEPMAGELVDLMEATPAPAGEVGDQAWTAPTTAPTTAPVATSTRPSLPSTGA